MDARYDDGRGTGRGFDTSRPSESFVEVARGESAVSLLAWLPVLGYLANLYGVYVTAMGLKEMHATTTTTRALLAALVPTLLGLVLLIPALLLPPPQHPPGRQAYRSSSRINPSPC